MKISSCEALVVAVRDGARIRARMIGGWSSVEIRKRNDRDFGPGGAHLKDIGAALVCANAMVIGKGSCYQVCEFVEAGNTPGELAAVDEWLSHEGNSFEITFEHGKFTVVKYHHATTAETPSSAEDIDLAMAFAFPALVHT